MSPLILKFLALARVVAVSALPVNAPVTLPCSLDACISASVSVNAPLDAPVAVVVANTTLSVLSSQPKNTLSPVVPLSRIRPRSLGFEPVFPEPSSIKASVIVVFVELIVKVLPLTVKSPDTVKSLNSTLSEVPTACPIAI